MNSFQQHYGLTTNREDNFDNSAVLPSITENYNSNPLQELEREQRQRRQEHGHTMAYNEVPEYRPDIVENDGVEFDRNGGLHYDYENYNKPL